jgi:hypothetical protein
VPRQQSTCAANAQEKLVRPAPSGAAAQASTVVLDDLAQAIRIEHGAVTAAAGSILDHASNAGDLLMTAQRRVGYGRWGTWLNEHCRLSVRQANNYMALARSRPKLEAVRHRGAELSLRSALRLIGRKPGTTKKPRPIPALNFASWQAASAEDQRAFVEAVGIDKLLAALPERSDRTRDPEPLNGVHMARIGDLLAVALSSGPDGERLGALNAINRVLASQGRDLHNLTAAFKRPSKRQHH